MEGGGVHVEEKCACGGGGGVYVEEREVCMGRRGRCVWGGTSNIYFFCAHILDTILPPFCHRLSIKTSGVIVLHVVAAARMMR